MATEQDTRLLQAFLDETLETARLVVERGDIRTVREREALYAAIAELRSRQPERIVAAYRHAEEVELADAGVVGRQLAAKVEIANVFAERLRSEAGEEPDDTVYGGRGRERKRGPWTRYVRVWL